jgi:hypothetical protein
VLASEPHKQDSIEVLPAVLHHQVLCTAVMTVPTGGSEKKKALDFKLFPFFRIF